MDELLITMKEIKKAYHTRGEAVQALNGITLDIFKGESVAIMGQSGSGKSTLLSIVGGMSPPTSGKVIIDGIDLYALSQEQRADFRLKNLGFVFQQFQLIPYLTALENVMLPLTTLHYSRRQKKEMAEHVLNRVGIFEEMNRLPSQISGGEQERVAIARALVNGPPLILADEPTGSLDTRTGSEIMELFQTLNSEGQTILIVTHNPDNTDYMGRTVIMKDGILTTSEVEMQKYMPLYKKYKGGMYDNIANSHK
ncbi:MAG: ABC transporter ATP-binding protein [Youngiibacter sp.]|jgi:putative ABC transport system ATP-binding protein|nr:ABC transporter ATP-binding protein [Youngiibacter sp.]